MAKMRVRRGSGSERSERRFMMPALRTRMVGAPYVLRMVAAVVTMAEGEARSRGR